MFHRSWRRRGCGCVCFLVSVCVPVVVCEAEIVEVVCEVGVVVGSTRSASQARVARAKGVVVCFA